MVVTRPFPTGKGFFYAYFCKKHFVIVPEYVIVLEYVLKHLS